MRTIHEMDRAFTLEPGGLNTTQKLHRVANADLKTIDDAFKMASL